MWNFGIYQTAATDENFRIFPITKFKTACTHARFELLLVKIWFQTLPRYWCKTKHLLTSSHNNLCHWCTHMTDFTQNDLCAESVISVSEDSHTHNGTWWSLTGCLFTPARAVDRWRPLGRHGQHRLFLMLCQRLHHSLSADLYNTIQYNTIQYNTIQYNTIQYNTIQYNTIQYNSVRQHSR